MVSSFLFAFGEKSVILSYYGNEFFERMKTMKDDIFQRELTWIELLSRAFQVFAANRPAVLTVLCVIFLPLSILQSVILDRMMMGADALNSFLEVGNMGQEQVMQLMMQTILHECLYFAVVLFLEPVGIIAIAKLTKQFLMQEELSAKKAMAEAMQMQPSIITAGLIYGVLVILGSMLIIPGVYLAIAWCLYLYCVGLCGDGGWRALCHSRELVKGNWWKTCLYYLALSAVVYLWNTVFQVIYLIGEPNSATDALYHFLTYFSNAFMVTGMALLFINRETMVGGMRIFAQAEEVSAQKAEESAESVDKALPAEVEKDTEKNEEE